MGLNCVFFLQCPLWGSCLCLDPGGLPQARPSPWALGTTTGPFGLCSGSAKPWEAGIGVISGSGSAEGLLQEWTFHYVLSFSQQSANNPKTKTILTLPGDCSGLILNLVFSLRH